MTTIEPVADEETLVSAIEAERFFGVPRRRVTRWYDRRSVVVRGSRRGESLYRLGDLVALNDAARSDTRSVYDG